MTDAVQVLTLITALGCGLMAGLFFAFSVCVMAALGRRPPAEGMATMQAINVAIVNPLFLTVFFATAAGCALCVVAGAWRWSEPGAMVLILGGAVYLVGGLLVTVAINVPLNKALARVAHDDASSAREWADYRRRWTAWNHARALASMAATVFLVLAVQA